VFQTYNEHNLCGEQKVIFQQAETGAKIRRLHYGGGASEIARLDEMVCEIQFETAHHEADEKVFSLTGSEDPENEFIGCR